MDESQRVSIEEALQAHTEFGAFSQKQEKVKGRARARLPRGHRGVFARPAAAQIQPTSSRIRAVISPSCNGEVVYGEPEPRLVGRPDQAICSKKMSKQGDTSDKAGYGSKWKQNRRH